MYWRIVLPFSGLSFQVVDGFLCCAKRFSLMQSHLFIFSFVSLAQGDISKKYIAMGNVDILLPMFSSRIFMVLSLILMSSIHFEFILMCGQRRWHNFIFYTLFVPFSQHHLLTRLYLAHCMFLLPLTNIDNKVQVNFWDFYFVPLIICSYLCQYHVVVITMTMQHNLILGSLIPLCSSFLSIFY